MQDATVVAYALANGACEHIIGPLSGACFAVGRDIRSDQPVFSIIAKDVPATFSFGEWRRARLLPVTISVTNKTLKQALGQVLSARESRLGPLEDDVG
jgi:hypothetical protein